MILNYYINPDTRVTRIYFIHFQSIHKKNRPESSLVVSFGKALNGIASIFEWLDC